MYGYFLSILKLFNTNTMSHKEFLSSEKEAFINFESHSEISVCILKDAQKHPEKYQDLIVRVAGYSDYFNDLSEELQNEVIRRTEHSEF